MNKIDVFRNKLPKAHSFLSLLSVRVDNGLQVPLERYFPEYTGGSDVNKAAKYILWRFMQANRARLSVYPQCVPLYSFPAIVNSRGGSLTQATDTSNIRLVFAAVKETILQNALKDYGIL